MVDQLKPMRTAFSDKLRREVKSNYFHDMGDSYNQTRLYQFLHNDHGFSSIELNVNKKSLVFNITFCKVHSDLVQSIENRKDQLFRKIDGDVNFTTTGQGHYRMKVVKEWDLFDRSRWPDGVRWVCLNGDRVIEILYPIISKYAAMSGLPMSTLYPVPAGLSSDNLLDEIETAKFELADLTETERETIIKSRIGQGKFRESLFGLWGGCQITDVKNPELLRASHIKPWRVSTNEERLDPNNGLLLTPAYEHLFDKGFITFSDDGQMFVSGELSQIEAKNLGINLKARIRCLAERSKCFLKYHRDHVFRVK